MHVISKGPLRQFWQLYPDAKTPLQAWHKLSEQRDFENFAQLRQTFRYVDKVGRFTVFDIRGNNYRLITTVHYKYCKIYVRAVLTHKEYDREHWKKE